MPKTRSRWQAGSVPSVDWTAVLRTDDGYWLRDSVGASAICNAESALEGTFPAALRSLYPASDGVFDEPGQWFVIWPLAEVVMRNQAAWADGSSIRRELLAFGDDGTSALFCVPVGGGSSTIGSRATHLPRSLPLFWDAWTTGSLPPY
jgi:cell wall assembly regulator SMI1